MKRQIFLLIVMIASNVAVAFGQNTALFNTYISKFEALKTDTIDNNTFQSHDQIDNKFVRLFISNECDCECEDEGLWYQYACKIEKKDFIFAFVYKNCDVPSSSGTYPYLDIMLLVYSRKGKLIDRHTVLRAGDLWDCNYSGSTNPIRLRVEQAYTPKEEIEERYSYPRSCTIITRDYTVTQDGRIKEKVFGKGKGTVVWDKERREPRIIKEQN